MPSIYLRPPSILYTAQEIEIRCIQCIQRIQRIQRIQCIEIEIRCIPGGCDKEKLRMRFT